MAVTLTQQEYLTQDTLRKGVISTFAENSAVLRYLPFLTINSNSYVYNREDTLPGSNFRAVGDNYSENAGTVSQSTETLKIMGGSFDVDRYLTITQNTNDIKAIQTAMLAKSIALDFDAAFFAGDAASADTEFDGLVNRLSGDQVIDGGDDALTLAEVDELIDATKGEPDVIYCDKAIIRKINNLMRAENQSLEYVDGQFGRKIPMYAGIPLVAVGEDSSGTPILNDNSSAPGYTIYGVQFGVDKVVGLQAEPLKVIDHGLYNGGVLQRVTMEWICSFIMAGPKSAAMLSNVTI
jgi:hypothetical protein